MSTNDLLNDSMEFDAGAVDAIDQSTVEGGGPQYPLIQWVVGNPTAKKYGGMDYLGGFSIKASGIDDAAMTAAGWVKTERTFKSGASEEVYWKREAALSIIVQRRRWEAMVDGKVASFPYDSFDAAEKAGGKTPQGRTQYLVLVKGLEVLGPMVFTTKGSVARAFESYRNANAVLSRFSNTVIRAANTKSAAAAKEAGKEAKVWPYRAFWLPVGADRDAKDQPIYTEVGKVDKTPVVLPVALGLPDKAESVDLGRFYVGKPMLDTVNALYDSTADWRTAWDNIKPGAVEGNGNGSGAHVESAEERAAADKEDAILAATGL